MQKGCLDLNNGSVEGVILSSIPFLDKGKILTVFSNSLGLVRFIIKGLCSKKSHILTWIEPFSQVEMCYQKHRSDLLKLTDIHPIDTHLDLRKRLSSLNAASQICKSLLHSQLPEKPSPPLYSLLTLYLKQIPLFEDPSSLVLSFYLKLLKQEGLIHLTENCSACTEAKASFLHMGEGFCKTHRPLPAQYFSEEHWKMLMTLLHAQNFAALKGVLPSALLMEQIQEYFREQLR